MCLAERNHKVQTLAPYGSDQPFAVGVRLRGSRGRAQHPQPKSLELVVHFCREDRVAVANEKPVGVIAWNCFSKLLQGPLGRWVSGDIAAHDTPCPHLHEDEYVKSSESGGHHDQKIAGDDGLGVIANKGPPVLRRGSAWASSIRFGRPIGAHGARRNIDAKLHR